MNPLGLFLKESPKSAKRDIPDSRSSRRLSRGSEAYCRHRAPIRLQHAGLRRTSSTTRCRAHNISYAIILQIPRASRRIKRGTVLPYLLLFSYAIRDFSFKITIDSGHRVYMIYMLDRARGAFSATEVLGYDSTWPKKT